MIKVKQRDFVRDFARHKNKRIRVVDVRDRTVCVVYPPEDIQDFTDKDRRMLESIHEKLERMDKALSSTDW